MRMTSSPVNAFRCFLYVQAAEHLEGRVEGALNADGRHENGRAWCERVCRTRWTLGSLTPQACGTSCWWCFRRRVCRRHLNASLATLTGGLFGSGALVIGHLLGLRSLVSGRSTRAAALTAPQSQDHEGGIRPHKQGGSAGNSRNAATFPSCPQHAHKGGCQQYYAALGAIASATAAAMNLSYRPLLPSALRRHAVGSGSIFVWLIVASPRSSCYSRSAAASYGS